MGKPVIPNNQTVRTFKRNPEYADSFKIAEMKFVNGKGYAKEDSGKVHESLISEKYMVGVLVNMGLFYEVKK